MLDLRPAFFMWSLSSCWNSHRHTDGRSMLLEIRELGFEHAELSHGIRISLMPGILDAVERGEIRISSLHNFCPLPVGITRPAPNLYQFSARQERERELAFRYTVKTLDFAVKVQAPLVVLHVGSVEMPHYTEKLEDLLSQGRRTDPAYAKLLEKATAHRDKAKADYVKRSQEVLKRVVEEAEKRGLKLGVECREALEEIPVEKELEAYLGEFQSPAVGYWHDTGHAQIKEHLGLLPHAEGLAKMAGRLFGFHIHDVQYPGRDHQPPGSGSIDFAALKPMARPEHIKVFEIHPSVSQEELGKGVAWLKQTWGCA